MHVQFFSHFVKKPSWSKDGDLLLQQHVYRVKRFIYPPSRVHESDLRRNLQVDEPSWFVHFAKQGADEYTYLVMVFL